MSLSRQQIEWRGDIFDAGDKCGIGGRLAGTDTQIAVALGKLSDVTPDKVVEAARKIEAAIISQCIPLRA